MVFLTSCLLANKVPPRGLESRYQGDHSVAGSEKGSQIHVRIGGDLKKAVKMFCVREGTTEQTWVVELVETELTRRAPDLWSSTAASRRRKQKSR